MGSRGKMVIVKGMALFFARISLGAATTCIGPTLIDLKIRFDTTYATISSAAALSGIGIILGSSIAGRIVEKFSWLIDVSMSVAHFIAIIAVSVTPFVMYVQALWVVWTLLGMSFGVMYVVGLKIIMNTWKKHTGMHIQIQMFAISLGAILAPVIANPFLMDTKIVPSSNDATEGNNRTCLTAKVHTSYTSAGATRVQYAYVLIGGLSLVTWVPWTILSIRDLYFNEKCSGKKSNVYFRADNGGTISIGSECEANSNDNLDILDKIEEDALQSCDQKKYLLRNNEGGDSFENGREKENNDRKYLKGIYKYCFQVIGPIYSFLIFCNLNIFFSFIRTFSAEHFSLDRDIASLVNTTYMIGYAGSAVLGGFISRCLSSRGVFIFFSLFQCCSILFLVCFSRNSFILHVAGSILISLTLPPAFNTLITFFNEEVLSKGGFLSVFICVRGIANLVSLWLTGRLYDIYGAGVIYVIVTPLSVLAFFFSIILGVISIWAPASCRYSPLPTREVT